VCELVFIGLGWYRVLMVEMFLKLLGFISRSSVCIGLLLNWKIFRVLLWLSSL